MCGCLYVGSLLIHRYVCTYIHIFVYTQLTIKRMTRTLCSVLFPFEPINNRHDSTRAWANNRITSPANRPPGYGSSIPFHIKTPRQTWRLQKKTDL